MLFRSERDSDFALRTEGENSGSTDITYDFLSTGNNIVYISADVGWYQSSEYAHLQWEEDSSSQGAAHKIGRASCRERV